MSEFENWLPDGPEPQRRPKVVDEPADDVMVLVVWPKRVCPHCGSEDTRVYGRSRDGSKQYRRCRSCRRKFWSTER